jgi:cytochrome oxidase Cu insertion factor (SCO1/SenC/PrrC family)
VEGGCELAFGSFCENKQNQSVMVAMIEKNGQILKKMAQGAEPNDLADELADLLVGA